MSFRSDEERERDRKAREDLKRIAAYEAPALDEQDKQAQRNATLRSFDRSLVGAPRRTRSTPSRTREARAIEKRRERPEARARP